jgi:DNA-3-methyladenine glycosylase II
MPNSYQIHFRRHDPILHAVVRQVGPFTLKPSRERFGMLVRSIIAQQISVGAAKAIRGRLEALVGGPRGMRPESLAALSIEQLRAVGLSPQKAKYVHDLAAKVQDGTVKLASLSTRTDEEIIENLIQVNGIGVWTAQMFLIFALGREDVFPIDDFGVRSAIKTLYTLDDTAKRADFLAIGERWRPFASVGSWYCWRWLDAKKKQPITY